MKTAYCILFVTVVLSACKTNLVYINATNPAPVTISAKAKNAGIVARTTPTEDNKLLNTIHQNRSGETIKLIQESSTESVRGLTDALIQNKRFDIVKQLTGLDLKTPVTGSFPSPLSWVEVEKICENNGIDVLFVLEVFDSELKVIPLTPAPAKINNVMDVINTATQLQANLVTTIKTGWRIYDPASKQILDEYPMTENLTITANVSTIVNTTEAMLGRKEAIKVASNSMGRYYADRVTPYWIKLTRDYYVKGSTNLKIATRKARTGNWDGAGELWLKDTKSNKRKLAGRACYNMAILNEINGDLDSAISWAQKAYEDYGNKLALTYVNMLKNRKQKNDRLNYQTGN